MQKGKVAKIKIFKKKGEPGKIVQKADCVADCGLLGDRFARGGEKQITITDDICENWLLAQDIQGLCFKRFKANITAENMDLSGCKAGQKLDIGTAQLVFSCENKECFDECVRVQGKMECLLRTHAKYLKVLKSGTINTDDIIETKE